MTARVRRAPPVVTIRAAGGDFDKEEAEILRAAFLFEQVWGHDDLLVGSTVDEHLRDDARKIVKAVRDLRAARLAKSREEKKRIAALDIEPRACVHGEMTCVTCQWRSGVPVEYIEARNGPNKR